MAYCKMVNPQGYQDCPYFCDSCATAERAAARAADAERAAAQEAAGAATCAACGGACGANSEDWWIPGGSMFFGRNSGKYLIYRWVLLSHQN